VIEVVLDRGLDQLGGGDGDQLLLGLALELRIADEDRQHGAGAAAEVVRVHRAGLLVAGHLGIGLQAAQQAGAQAGLVAAALGCRHGIAVGVEEAVLVERPGDRPFDAALLVGELRFADEGLRRQGLALVQRRGEEILQAVGEVDVVLFRRLVVLLQQRLVAGPADLDAAVEISLGARHAVEPGRAELRLLAEDRRIGMEGDGGAAPVLHRRALRQLRGRLALGIALHVELLVARHLDGEVVGEGVHHRDADAVQAAGGRVGLLRELGAGVQRGEDHLQRRLRLVLRVRVDRDAAAVVADDDPVARLQLDLDARGMAGNGLVHGVVQHLGHQVVHGAFVAAADVHAGAPAHRLEAFQDLDVLGRIARLFARRLFGGGLKEVRHLGLCYQQNRGVRRGAGELSPVRPNRDERIAHRVGYLIWSPDI